MSFFHVAFRYLHALRLGVSKRFLRLRMESHPDYPSLVALTDSLDEIGLSYSAIIADKKKYYELEYPLLAHVKQKKYDDFVMVKSAHEFEQQEGALLNSWDGIVVMVPGKQDIKYTKNNKAAREEKKSMIFLTGLILSFAILVAAPVFINFSSSRLALLLLNLIGLGICAIVVMQSMGKSSIIGDQLCSGEDNSGCEKVLNSKLSILWEGFKLGDLGVVYFTAVNIFLAVSFLGQLQWIFTMAALVLIAAFLSIYSVYYQFKIVKSWCRLCLLTAGVIWLQAAILTKIYVSNSISISLVSPLVLVGLLLVCLLIWVVVKKMIEKADASDDQQIAGLRFRRDWDVFKTLLRKQTRIDVLPWPEDLVFGNPEGKIHLVAACNPYCAPCAKAHKILSELLTSYGAYIRLTIRFAIHIEDITERRSAAVANIIHAYCQNGKEASDCLDDWYMDMDLRKFKVKYKSADDLSIYLPVIRKHIQWTTDNALRFTPRLYIAGYQLPPEYSIDDLKLMINPMIENITPSQNLVDLFK